MDDIATIMDMLDWNMSLEIQTKGRELAKKQKCVKPFIQPLSPQYNKNVWENCALILGERSDEELKPYLVELMEWLQDMNWPGAFLVCDRLQKYVGNDSFKEAYANCFERAKRNNDEIWERNLTTLAKCRMK